MNNLISPFIVVILQYSQVALLIVTTNYIACKAIAPDSWGNMEKITTSTGQNEFPVPRTGYPANNNMGSKPSDQTSSNNGWRGPTGEWTGPEGSQNGGWTIETPRSNGNGGQWASQTQTKTGGFP